MFRLLRQGGISRCFADLIAGLPNAELDVRLTFRLHGNQHLRAPGLLRLPIQVFQLLGRLGLDPAPSEAWAPTVALGGLDLLHATYYLGAAPPRGLPFPLVSTLHDMTPERLPQLAPLGRGGHRVQKRAWLEASDAIVAVSASSAADLATLAPALAGRTRVIHHGTRFFDLTPRPCPGVPAQPFHLFVGRRGGFKNTTALFEVLAALPQHLVLVGGGPLSRRERHQMRQRGLQGRVRTLNPDDAQLAWLYRHCRAVLVPSLAEGFSLPLIEALACDAPVLASDLAVHREIGGSFVELLDPQNPDQWRSALSSAGPLPRPSERLSRTQAAELSHHFSLERMVADYRSFYRSLR
ncbi:glycosyltransferase family 4 protein [Cyanobium sp. ATX 6F1]|uniref:glycosyltransferase family 4 protein n=1 Tax=Cyanobium sp. ATX 6F1 TaxID=2823702 RepID=UPI0020CCE3D4|nr:glycosyltransferase family 1 protein [Cyanobium sp. ATX 6F1]